MSNCATRINIKCYLVLDVFRIAPYLKNIVNLSTESSKKINSLDFQHNYNDQQVSKILTTINSRPEAELIKYQISKQRIKKIEARKQKLGEFSSIEDILELDGFGVKVLEKFCESILATNDDDKRESAPNEDDQLLLSSKKQQFVSPNLLEKFRKTITSCVSFNIDLNYVAWTKLSLNTDEIGNPVRVEEWVCYQVGNDNKKLSLADLIQIALHLDSKVPSADVYVVEAAPTPQIAKQPSSPVQMSINVQKSQFLAMLSILMASREADDLITIQKSQSYLDETDQLKMESKMRFNSQQKLFFLRNFLASRLYKTYVGNERVSTGNVIEKLLRYNYPVHESKKPSFESLNVPEYLREYYKTSGKLDREFMGQSMLIGLTFIKVCILKCPHSMALLMNKRNDGMP